VDVRVPGKVFGNRAPFRSAIVAAALLAAPYAHAQEDPWILYHEPLRLLRAAQAGPADDQLVFDALGRRFELNLRINQRLQRGRTLRNYDLLRGELEGVPGSWVRLTRQGERLSGMLFDGADLYAIEPWADVAEQSLAGGDNSGELNTVYRLRDVLMPVGAASCARSLSAEDVRGDVAFAQLGDELDTLPPMLEAQGASRRIELRAVADYEFFQAWGADSEAQVLARMNIVDGIFSEQLGLEIGVSTVEVFQTAADPFSTDNPGDLLDEVVDYRVSRDTGEGLTHLFTWRNLAGSTRGIAYLGSACSNTFAAALSQQSSSSLTFGSLIAAHEIGHNLNAQHDGEVSTEAGSPNPCDTVPETFLMAPTISGSDQFSQCSLDVMTNYLNTLPEACVTGIGPALDDVPANLSAVVDEPRTLTFSVVNSGSTATGVELSLTFPASLDVQPQGLACTLDQGSALCNLGDLVDGAQVPVTFSVTSPTNGDYSIIVALATDPTPDADRATVRLNVTSAAAVDSGGGGGGGGGAVGPLSLLLLAGLGALGRRRPTRR
jgi:hypothetical protein